MLTRDIKPQRSNAHSRRSRRAPCSSEGLTTAFLPLVEGWGVEAGGVEGEKEMKKGIRVHSEIDTPANIIACTKRVRDPLLCAGPPCLRGGFSVVKTAKKKLLRYIHYRTVLEFFWGGWGGERTERGYTASRRRTPESNYELENTSRSTTTERGLNRSRLPAGSVKSRTLFSLEELGGGP